FLATSKFGERRPKRKNPPGWRVTGANQHHTQKRSIAALTRQEKIPIPSTSSLSGHMHPGHEVSGAIAVAADIPTQ
ncbi:hypothetical protein, partial [Mesorhizobium ciceri]|uniref:hypothetical protein n=1 Tax=Mesorhizobium ciceri TaxID=39645 RepID=UPI00344FC059